MNTKITALDGVVLVVFSHRAQAEAAIADLRMLGFADDELGVIVPYPTRHYLLDDSTHEALSGLGHGLLVGTPLGALGGSHSPRWQPRASA